MNVYDFDGTIYNGDSTVDFWLFCLSRKISILKYLPLQIFSCFLYKVKIISKKRFKEIFFIFLCDINTYKMVEMFWRRNDKKIFKYYYDIHSEEDLVISASPLFLIKPICNKLKIRNVIATDMNSNNGVINGNNCYGEEKVKAFKNAYGDIPIDIFYTDSYSDKPLMMLANKNYLIKKGKIYSINKNDCLKRVL